MNLITVLIQLKGFFTPRVLILTLATLSICLSQTALAAPPVNDMFASATVISNLSGTINGTNVDATAEIDEPSHGASGTPSHSVWYKWTAPTYAFVIFDTNGSDYDTAMAAYIGTAVDNLVQLDGDDDSGEGLRSKISFYASSGQDYYIAVDGFSTSQGQIQLNWGPAQFISGTVSLPAGHVAPTGGIPLNIYLIGEQGYTSSFTPVIISEGNSSTEYLLVGSHDAQTELTVAYSYPGSEYLQSGFYNSSGTQWSLDDAEYFAGGANRSGIDLTLLTGRTVSGTLHLPNGQLAPPGGTPCSVLTLDDKYFVKQYVSFMIADGESSASYTVRIPDSFKASLGINAQCIHSGIYPMVFYNSSGPQWDSSNAQFLYGGTDYTSINMTFFPLNTITGTVSLPGSDTAPGGGYMLSVRAFNDGSTLTYPINVGVVIPGGGSSGGYGIMVPSDPNADWRVSYDLYSPDYLQHGFYSTSETQQNPANATLLVGGADYSNIDLTLLSSTGIDTITISGTISLPVGQVAPSGGLLVDIRTVNTRYEDHYYHYTSWFNQGESSNDFSFEIPSDASVNWLPHYEYWWDNQYEFHGYYRGNKTVCNRKSSFLLNGGTDHTNIGLKLLDQCEGLVCFPVRDQNNTTTMICF